MRKLRDGETFLADDYGNVVPDDRWFPTADRVIVRVVEPKTVSDGGIHMVNPDQPRECTILAVGPGRITETGHLIEPRVRVGDRALIYKGRGHDIEWSDGTKVRVLTEGDLMCVKGPA